MANLLITSSFRFVKILSLQLIRDGCFHAVFFASQHMLEMPQAEV